MRILSFYILHFPAQAESEDASETQSDTQSESEAEDDDENTFQDGDAAGLP